MGLTRLTGWSGEAVVLGGLVQVEFSEGVGLVLKGLGQDAAMAVLDALKTPTIATVVPSVEVVKAADTMTPEERAGAARFIAALAKDKAQDLETAKVVMDAPPPVTEPIAEAAPAKPKKPKLVITDAPTPAAEAAPELKSKTVAEFAATAAPPAGAPVAGGMVEALRGANKLRDVLAVLADAGIKEQGAVIAKCEELKSQVPLLARIGNLGERISRTLEVFGG